MKLKLIKEAHKCPKCKVPMPLLHIQRRMMGMSTSGIFRQFQCPKCYNIYEGVSNAP